MHVRLGSQEASSLSLSATDKCNVMWRASILEQSFQTRSSTPLCTSINVATRFSRSARENADHLIIVSVETATSSNVGPPVVVGEVVEGRTIVFCTATASHDQDEDLSYSLGSTRNGANDAREEVRKRKRSVHHQVTVLVLLCSSRSTSEENNSVEREERTSIFVSENRQFPKAFFFCQYGTATISAIVVGVVRTSIVGSGWAKAG